MALPLRTSEAGIELVRSFEGFRARSAAVSGGRWIIGYGHTASARRGLRISRKDADLVLRFHDLPRIERFLAAQILTPLTQNEFDALVSFVFNIGETAFKASSVLTHLNAGNRIAAADAMLLWRRGRMNGEVRVIDALVRRRAAEVALFLEHPLGRLAVPGAVIRPQSTGSVGGQLGEERTIFVEPRAQAEPAVQSPPSSPEAAGRDVAERLRRILGEEGSDAPPAKGQGTSVDEITRAVSALAEQDPPAAAPPHRSPPKPPSQPAQESPRHRVISDVEPAKLDPDYVPLGLRKDPSGLTDLLRGDWRWLPFALLAGLGLVGLFAGVGRYFKLAQSDLSDHAADIYVGPLLALGSGFLFVVSVYYLYQALVERD